MRPFEFTAIPRTSPRFMSGEYFKKSGTESNGILGAATVADSWAFNGISESAGDMSQATAVAARNASVMQSLFFTGPPSDGGRTSAGADEGCIERIPRGRSIANLWDRDCGCS